MKIASQITLKEYMKLLMGRAYHKPAMLVIVTVGVGMALWIISFHLGLSFLPEPQYYQYTTLALIAVVQPTALFFITRKSYRSSSHLQEKVEMEFTPEHIRLRGDTFVTELTWAAVFKVVELPQWFMVYHNSLTAILVPKRSFHAAQEQEFKHLLRSIPGLKLTLR